MTRYGKPRWEPANELEAARFINQGRARDLLHLLDKCLGDECWVCVWPVIWCSRCGDQLRYSDGGDDWVHTGDHYACQRCGRGVGP